MTQAARDRHDTDTHERDAAWMNGFDAFLIVAAVWLVVLVVERRAA